MKPANRKLITYIFLSLLLYAADLHAQWSNDHSVNNLVGSGVPIMAVSDDRGGAFILNNPHEDLNITVGVFRVDQFGFVRFPYLGFSPTYNTFIVRQEFGMINDGRNGVFISFHKRNIFPDAGAVVIHRIDSSGVQLWGSDGLIIAENIRVNIEFRSIVNDGENGSILFWTERPGTDDLWELKMQRIDPDKNKLWGENGISVANMVTDESINAELVNNEIYFSYTAIQDSVANKEARYVQKINISGELLWADPVEVNVNSELINDGFGGVVTAGILFDSSSDAYLVTAQRIDENGVKLWGDNGSTISENATIITKNASIQTDNNGNYVFVWNSGPVGKNNIYAQKLNSIGEKQWDANDIMVGDPNQDKIVNIKQGVISDGNLNTIIIWRRLSGKFLWIFGQMIDKDGEKNWGDTELTISSLGKFGAETDPVIVSDNNGGAIAFWYNTSFRQLYSQNIKDAGLLGENILTAVIDEDPSTIPQNFRLFQNYPNPFNPTTTIRFQIPKVEDVKISIYNLIGQEVEHLVDRQMAAGSYSVVWDAASFASGIYFYTIEAGLFSDKKRLTLIK